MDAAHRLLSRTDPLGRVTRFDHDARTLTLPDGSTHPVPPRPPAHADDIEFDALGRVRATGRRTARSRRTAGPPRGISRGGSARTAPRNGGSTTVKGIWWTSSTHQEGR
ncbi:RHS repeat domain-containing protein [Micromonospora sp. BRA006-A]|nr:RHS repeat domain-containing protein [Micromonospora sp. BRA006-A]